MKINFNTNYMQPNFKSAYTVNSVNINGKHYGNRQKEEIYLVSRAFASDMYKGMLAPDVQRKADKLFPDYIEHRFTMIARSPRRDRNVNVLAGFDAQKYKDVYLSNDRPEDKREIGEWVLNDILKRNGRKKIIISANEVNGRYIITDIKRHN